MYIRTIIKVLALPIFISLMSACSSHGSGYVEVTHYHEEIDENPTSLSLFQFDMIDSYETNSEFDGEHLAVHPYINFGQFEVFWNIHSEDDYFIELRVNDEPYIEGSRLISSEYCSIFDSCYFEQYQFCEYTEDLTIICDTPNGSTQSTSIDRLLEVIPQDLYIILQVCDADYFYCEYESVPVLFE